MVLKYFVFKEALSHEVRYKPFSHHAAFVLYLIIQYTTATLMRLKFHNLLLHLCNMIFNM
jgi:hypothetical protein